MIIQNKKQFDDFLEILAEQTEVVVDTETTGLKVWSTDRLCGIGFAFPDGRSFYLPYRHKEFAPGMDLFIGLENPEYNLPLQTLENLWEVLEKVPRLIGHNLKFDLAALYQDGYRSPDDQEIEDTLPGARIFFPDKAPDMSLEGITKHVLGKDVSKWKRQFKDYLEERKIKNHYDRAEIPVIAEYCEKDCLYTFEARQKFVEHSLNTDQDRIYDMERDLLKVLWEIESEGLMLDKEYIRHAISECRRACAELMEMIEEYTGPEFNPWSNPQISSVAAILNIPIKSRTPTGQPQWTDEVLRKLEHPLAKLILDWRAVDKMVSTFFQPYLDLGGDFVHPSFKSWGAVTGRFSCSDPNLQQVSRPVDWKDEGFTLPWFDIQVRRMFTAPEGYRLVLMDYSQMEMVGFSDYLNDQKLRDRLNAGQVDFHSLVACLIFNTTEDDPEFKKKRKFSKSISLGLVYGMGIDKLAKSLGISEDEAKMYKKIYFKQFPTAPDFINKVYRRVEEVGYVFNQFGRRYELDVDYAYKGVNYLVQGTCADLIKMAMIRIRNLLKKGGFKTRIAFQMHDEFGFYVKEEEWSTVVPLLQAEMEKQVLKTKLFVDISVADPSWGDKSSVCKKCYSLHDGQSCGEQIVDREALSSKDFIDESTGAKIPSVDEKKLRRKNARK